MSFLQRIFKKLRPSSRTRPTDPKAVEALKLIEEGQTEEKAGRLDKARMRYEEAVLIAPNLAKAHMNLGNAHLALREVNEAMNCYQKSLDIDQNYAQAHYNLGNVYWQLNKNDEALRSYLRATEIDPKFALPWVGIANTLAGMEKHDDAIAACKQAIVVDKSNAEAYVVMGMILRDQNLLDESIKSMRKAVQIRPDHPIAPTNLANYLEHAFRFKEAHDCYREAIRIAPNIESLKVALLYLLSQDPKTSPKSLYEQHLAIGSEIERREEHRRRTHHNLKNPNRKIRVGFISADLRNHAVVHFVEPIFRHLRDIPEIELFAYYNFKDEDDGTIRIKSYFSEWRAIAHFADDDVENIIRKDAIDILIDLSGYTAGSRLSVLARKPAPIQASWIGYPGTTGLKAIDYYLADPYFLPIEKFSWQFVEKLVYLPSTAPYLPFSVAPPIAPLPFISQGVVNFGSFNRPSKISHGVVRLWARVLRAVPNSRFLITGMVDDYQIGVLENWFQEENIPNERLEFKIRSTIEPYLKLHHAVDICLDTFPYTGGTTTRHALWMGVPTITIAGSTPASRQASSIMELVGLGDFVASSEDEFVSIAQSWSNRTDELAEIRTDMRIRIARSPLGRPEFVASAFVKATRIMWQRWCAGEPPDFIDVSQYGA